MGTLERPPSRPTVRGLLAATIDRQTYKNLAYLLLAIPLGFFYATLVGFALVFGLLTFVVGIGVVILFVTLIGVRLVARFERWLANALLGTTLEAPNDRADVEDTWGDLASYLSAVSTWRALGFVQLKFFFTIVAIFLLFGLWTALDLLTTPARYPVGVEFGEMNDQPVIWSIDTMPEAALAVGVGVVLAFVLLTITNVLGYFATRMAIALLDGPTVEHQTSSVGDDTKPDPDASTDAEASADTHPGPETGISNAAP